MSKETPKIIGTFVFDKIAGKCYKILMVEEVDLSQAEGWQPIETAPKDGSKIVRWHIIYSCEVTVRYKPGCSNNKSCVWVDGTYSNTWPEAAFTPHWKLQGNSPGKKV